MANDPTDPEYSLIQVNKTLSEIIVSICNCGISPKPWPVCTILWSMIKFVAHDSHDSITYALLPQVSNMRVTR